MQNQHRSECGVIYILGLIYTLTKYHFLVTFLCSLCIERVGSEFVNHNNPFISLALRFYRNISQMLKTPSAGYHERDIKCLTKEKILYVPVDSFN